MTSHGQTPAVRAGSASATGHGTPAAGRRRRPLTMGAEEEYLLVDPVTRELRPEAPKVVAGAAAELGARVTTEITCYQVEARTDPHTSLAAFAEQVRAMRGAVVRAAARHGLGVVSSGTPVLPQPHPLAVTDGPRYARSVAMFGALDDEQTICACHLHIGVPDVDLALQVSNHLRGRLPQLIALAANSPYWQGRDTGYASWRTLAWARWPAAGPPPHFDSTAHFDALVEDLTATGTIMDRGGLYWDIRPSHHVPTLEIRAFDATPAAADTVLLAAVTRALVATALADIEAGRPAFRPPSGLLRTACWRAARDGLTGDAVDLRTRRLRPAVTLVERMLEELRPALLHHGDLDAVTAGWARLRAVGTGAERQRAAHRGRDRPVDVVDALMRSVDADERPA
ncbi:MULTISPECIES: carboxylate-amine ligase [Streptomyces]|uniref:Putative glutamate--cysteine ligase 2 n=2 Tax=Streptomyces TaxID=1883 RepID=A0ABU4KHJ2_9ACTN|nr:glutamate--cysteine ligase [Streptomyces roseolus]MDX2297258.1 glutamate--cysteine ligase [Streptomyces roseolus]